MALGVPGMIIAPFGRLDKEKLLVSNISGDADENGVYHTAFIFYAGDQTEVLNDEIDLDGSGVPTAVVSGFMPIHSAKRLLSKWVEKTDSLPTA